MGGGGQMVLFDDKQAPFLSAFNPRVAGVRSGASFFCTVCGDGTAADAASFAGQVLAITTAHAGSNRRLADDKIMVHGLRALERGGFAVPEGEAITERVRAIKDPDAVRAMRCALHACEQAIAAWEIRPNRGAEGGRDRGCDPGGASRRQHPGGASGSRRACSNPAWCSASRRSSAPRGAISRSR
jgi:hypothetical protein